MSAGLSSLSDEQLLTMQDELLRFVETMSDASGRAAADQQLAAVHAELQRRGLPSRHPRVDRSMPES